MNIRPELLRALLFIEGNLNEDLRLESVARRARLSPAYFHRLFRATAGETLQQYVERLRLEKSRRLLRITDLSVLQIALECGYNSQENFTRRFKHRFGESPGRLRTLEETHSPTNSAAVSLDENDSHTPPDLIQLRELRVAFFRLRGDYYQLPPIDQGTPGVWRNLSRAVRDPGPFLGICHDDPRVTPPEKIRFDACVQTDESPEGESPPGIREIPRGFYARTIHLGDSSTIHRAYASLSTYTNQLNGFRPASHPPFEIYLEYTNRDIARTEIYLALERA